MGLRFSPGKQEAKKGLVKAATSIDCISVMVDKLAPRLSKGEVAGFGWLWLAFRLWVGYELGYWAGFSALRRP